MNALNCPKGHGSMTPKTVTKELTFNAQALEVEAEVFICTHCGLEAGTLETGGALQQAVSNAYFTKTGKHA